MPDPITITIPGDAVPKGRPRLSTIAGHATAYTPAKTRAHEGYLRAMFAQEMAQRGLQPLTGAVAVTITVIRAIPKSAKKRDIPEMIAGLKRPATRPDIDNYAKAVLDAANGVLFVDDGQICRLMCEKRFADAVGAPGSTHVTVEALESQTPLS